MNFSGVRLDMSFKEAMELDAIIKRDKARPPEKGTFLRPSGEEGTYYTCPVCGEYLWEGDKFCKTCGQRIDMENIAL